ncbi:hypothetical protein BF95_08755 [Sphingobium sp. Ant17]|nr:hypothetical protein BF95_08755 [Sphingobium sp. Ant17]
MRITLQTFLNLQRQTAHATSHVCVTQRDPDLRIARHGDHPSSPRQHPKQRGDIDVAVDDDPAAIAANNLHLAA